MKIVNKKAKFNYRLYEIFEAGIVLTGSEAKAIKRGSVDLTHSYAKVINDEAFLINANIAVDSSLGKPSRTRKLLLKKAQIISIKSKIKAKRLTLIPLSVYTKGRLVKVEVALAKAKRVFEKREALKRKDVEREIEAELKNS